jgi:hypothetical protein
VKKKCLVFEVICLSSHSHLIKKKKIKKLGINNSRTIQENSKHFTYEVSKVTIYQNLKWSGSIALQTEVNKLPEKTRSSVQTCISMVRIRVCKKNNPLFPFWSEHLPLPTTVKLSQNSINHCRISLLTRSVWYRAITIGKLNRPEWSNHVHQSFWNSSDLSDLGGRKSWGLPITSVMPVPISAKHFWMMCLLF